MNKSILNAFFIFIVLGMLGCSKSFYADPISTLANSDQQYISGSYNPSNDIIDYFYATNAESQLEGPFIWNKYYESELEILSRFFNSKLYQPATYVSGNFVEGELDGKVFLMRSQTSSPEQGDIDTIGYYNYKLGQLDGIFELSRLGQIYHRGNYDNGKLEGELLHKEGTGIFNGIEIGNQFEWHLNYKNGSYDSVQTLYMHDTIVEMLSFEEGEIIEIIEGWNDRGFVRLDNDQFVYKLNRSSLYFSILGRMFEKDHTSTIRSEKFGDSSFSGEVKFCDGKICNGSFTVTRIIGFNGESSREETFEIDK